MAFVKKVWKDRIAEYINRRLLTKEDGTQELVTVARNEGNISQEGDAFNAANMNDLEERIANEFQVLNEGIRSLLPYENTELMSKCVMASTGIYGYVSSSMIPLLNADKYNITVLSSNYSDINSGTFKEFSGLGVEYQDYYGFTVSIQNSELASKAVSFSYRLTKK